MKIHLIPIALFLLLGLPFNGRFALADTADKDAAASQGAAAAAKLYDEQYRPQFHFTAEKNWLNDPNGLVYYAGEYHLFFQHNPQGREWGNMTWGHAVSPDLTHWKQLDHAIYPDKLGTIFSGSAVVDEANTAGFQEGNEKTLVAIFTSAGGTSPDSKGERFTQSLAYSNDRGRTWKIYERNPVLKHIAGENRDPKVFWHPATKSWVMALYLEGDKFALFASPDLKTWKKLSDVPAFGDAECPDLFELPVEGDPQTKRWIFWGASSNYMVGRFDGTSFVKESGPHRFEYGNNSYAAQTYSDIPAADGRRIQIAWMRGGSYPGMPFNQQMTYPCELTLRKFPEGLRVCSTPVKEIEKLHGKKFAWAGVLRQGENPVSSVSGDLFDVRATIAPGNAKEMVFSVRGTPIRFDFSKKEIQCLGKTANFELIDGELPLQILIDRSSLEIFANRGKTTMSFCFLSPAENKSLSITAQGEAEIKELNIWELNSSWAR